MKKLLTRPISVLLMLFVLFFCEKEFDGERPFVRLITLKPSDLSESGITLHGEILGINTEPISDYGFMIDSKKIDANIFKNPDILKFSLAGEPAKVGPFSYRLESQIIKGVTYYIRAYAYQGSNALVMGEEFSFVSQGGSAVPGITDFFPSDIVPGDTITITGKDFTLGLPKITVKIGGVNIPVLGTPTNNSIKIQVPLGIPPTGKIELTVGTAVLSLDKMYQRLKPIIVNAPTTAKYGNSFFIECQNISKIPFSTQVKIGGQDCVVIEEQKNGLVCKLNDNVAYPAEPFGSDLTITVESFSATRRITLVPPSISSITPAKGISGDEILILGDGFANNASVTSVNFSGKEVGFNAISILGGGKQIRLKIPAYTAYPQDLIVAIKSGSLISNSLGFNLNPKLITLSSSQQTWPFAFKLNDQVYLGTSTARTPFERIDPLQTSPRLRPVSSTFDQTFDYVVPLQNNQILALNRDANNNAEANLIDLPENSTAQLISNGANKIPLDPATTGLGLTKGIMLQPNKLAYVYTANGVQSFWEFNPTSRQFKALAPIPSNNGAKISELVFFDQGSKLIAAVSYVGNDQAQLLEYIPAINLWQKLYQIPLNGLVANDGFTYPVDKEPGFFYILSFLGQDRFAFGNEEFLLYSNAPVVYRKQQDTKKKAVFLIQGNVIVVDEESIYRTKLLIN